MTRNFINTALKHFWKNRIYNFINILGLTVSITSILIILLYIGNENKYDSGIHNNKNIYRLETNWATMPSFIGHFLKNESDYIEDVVRIKIEDHEIISENEVFGLKNIGMADTNFFDVFNFNFILGNPENALKTIHSIVLTKSESDRIFGSSDPLNKIILIKNKYPFTVTGVVEDPDYFHLPFTAIATLESLKELSYKEVLEQKDGWNYFTYVVGKPGLSKEETELKVDAKMKELNYKDYPFSLTRLDDLYFAQPLYYEGINLHGNKQILYVLFSIAVLLLFLAVINFINLTNARASTIYREVGIKKLVGGSKVDLILQILFESVQIIVFALVLSLILIKIIQPYFCQLVNKSIEFNTVYLPLNLLIITVTTIMIGILAGLSPAYAMNSIKPILLLKNKTGQFSGRSYFGKSLITFQYLISIVLIACTLMIVKQLHFLKQKDIGFSLEQVLCVELNDIIKTQQISFKNELLRIPGVLQAAYSGNQMGHDWSNWVNDIDGVGRAFKVNSVEPGYFDLMGITIKEGRAFQNDDVDKCYIINETAAQKYGLSKPLEKLMKRDNKYYPIIGVVNDFNFQSPQYPIEPVLFNFRDKNYNLINLKIATTNTADILKEIERVWKEFCPSNVFEFNFMDELYNNQYKSAEQFSLLVGIGGGIAILIACLGILGLTISSAEIRIKEVGIRKINGATVLEVMAMLNSDFVGWVVLAFIIATPIAYYATFKWLENFAYKTPLSWWVFVLAGLLALGIALLTVSWQSWRAATRNPVEALRYE